MSELDKALKLLNKRLGKNFISKGLIDAEYDRHQVGVYALDRAIGGGLPSQKIMMVAGAFSSSKTTTCMRAAGECQKAGGVVAWLDVEAAFDPRWARKQGMSCDEKDDTFIYSKPSTAEETCDIAETLAATNEVDLIVIDSIAAMVSEAVLEKSASDKTMGGNAKTIGVMMVKLTTRLKKSPRTRVILINQLRDRIGGYGSPEYMPGGRQLCYQCDIIVWLRAAGTPIGGKENAKGIEVKFRISKNRTAPPYQIGTYDLYSTGIFDNKKSIILDAVKHGLIDKGGAWYEYKNERHQGVQKLKAALSEEDFNELTTQLLGMSLDDVDNVEDLEDGDLELVETDSKEDEFTVT